METKGYGNFPGTLFEAITFLAEELRNVRCQPGWNCSSMPC